MTSGYSSHFDGSPTPGVVPGVVEDLILLTPGDVDELRETLASDDDVAAVILEPTGSGFGIIPIAPGFLASLRELTAAHGVVLIFDEVITGFRVSPGGAQAHYDVIPDLTTLAKILAGGLPGGAVVGRKEILDRLDFEMSESRGQEKIQHQGTFNANPLSAAAGVAALEIVGSTDACDRANAYGAELRARVNEMFEAEDVPWAVYGTFSGIHTFMNPQKRKIRATAFDPFDYSYEELKANSPELVNKLRLAMLVNGVDLSGSDGLFSMAHTDDDLARTVDAFRESVIMLRREGEL